MSRAYQKGLDVLGLGVGDFVPWLGVVSKAVGGLTGSGGDDKDKSKAATEEAIKKALEQERVKQQAAKAEAQAATMRMVLFGTLGAVGVGGILFFALRKK